MTQKILDNLVSYRKGKPPIRQEGARSRLVPVLTPEYLRSGIATDWATLNSDSVELKGNELVLLWDGSNAGEFFRARAGLLASTMVVFNLNKSDVNKDFLYYELKRFEPSLKSKTSGSGIPHVDKELLLSHEVNLPPVDHQSKIAEVLAATDHAIEQTETLIAKHKRVRTGLMQDLLTRGIDENGSLRALVQRGVAGTEGRFHYPGWNVKSLNQVADVSSGVTLGRKVSGPDAVTLPYLRVFNVQDGYVDLSDVKTVTIRKGEIARFKLEKGDVLMNEGGDFDKLGRGTVWDGQIVPCLHQNHVFRVRTDGSQLLPAFLALICTSPYGRRFFVLSSKQSTNLASINSTQLKGFPVPCPDVAEQQRILDVFAAHEDTLSREQARLAKLKRVKVGLMQDLLTGRVSVTPLLDNEDAAHENNAAISLLADSVSAA